MLNAFNVIYVSDVVLADCGLPCQDNKPCTEECHYDLESPCVPIRILPVQNCKNTRMVN